MTDGMGPTRFAMTPTHPCGYFPDRAARTLLLAFGEPHSTATYSLLATAGFRRSGGRLYRPRCDACQACVPIRIVVDAFRPKRRFQRVLARNADLSVELGPAVLDDAHYRLYDRYIRGRHADGEMYPPSREQFQSFLLSDWTETVFLDVWRDGTLLATAVTDVLDHGLAAVYTFFDPELPARSLGVFAILQQVAECQRRGLPHLYIGYWIAAANKMRYKTDYQPAEVLIGRRWARLPDAASNTPTTPLAD